MYYLVYEGWRGRRIISSPTLGIGQDSVGQAVAADGRGQEKRFRRRLGAVSGRNDCRAKAEGNDLVIYGLVTDGRVWQFGKLERDAYTYNEKLFTLDELAELLGALDYVQSKLQEQLENWKPAREAVAAPQVHRRQRAGREEPGRLGAAIMRQ